MGEFTGDFNSTLGSLEFSIPHNELENFCDTCDAYILPLEVRHFSLVSVPGVNKIREAVSEGDDDEEDKDNINIDVEDDDEEEDDTGDLGVS